MSPRLAFLAHRIPIRAGERVRVALATLDLFLLLSSYYVLRPVRDEMGVRAGVARMPWLFTATSLAMLGAFPAFGWIASRFPRRRLVPTMHLFFAANLLVLAAAVSRPSSAGWAGPVLFVWVSVVSVFAVSASWSLFSDVFRREEARRLFGIVAAGGSAGALVGPAAVSLLAPRVEVPWLLVAAAVLFLLCAGLSGRLVRGAPIGAPEPTSRPIGGPALSGVRATARSPLLLMLALALVCYTFLSTVLYFAQTEIVGAAIRDSGRRTALFARMDFAVNVLAILLQLLVTGPLIRRIGVGGALAAVAGAVTAGVAALSVSPRLATIVILQVAHRAGHFAVGRPARESLFVPLDAEARYKAKNFIDTAVFRVADSASAWFLTAFRSIGMGLSAAAWVAVPVGLVWTATCWRIGRAEARSAKEIRPLEGGQATAIAAAGRRSA